MSGGPGEPLVSIVTPSLNMGRFLEETIQSVLGQEYPRIEYLVMDGGSSDGTAGILKRFQSRLRYVSAPDHGQADAINRGFEQTSGEIFAFLNADDLYLPGAISAAVKAFAAYPVAGVVYGDAWYVGEDGARIRPYPVERFDPDNLTRRCFICQPAAFFRRQAFASCRLDSRLRFALDYDLWIRMSQRFPMVKIDGILAASRLHEGSKTVGEMQPAMRETIEVLRRHYGYVPYNWLYGYTHHVRTGQPVAIEKSRPSLSSAWHSVAMGARYNWRHPFRYCLDIVATAKKGLA
jgi:glycosyltransferase involved in cell wall biosynthesis